jgi:hypothetical protein
MSTLWGCATTRARFSALFTLQPKAFRRTAKKQSAERLHRSPREKRPASSPGSSRELMGSRCFTMEFQRQVGYELSGDTSRRRSSFQQRQRTDRPAEFDGAKFQFAVDRLCLKVTLNYL